MNACQLLERSLKANQQMINNFLSDLSDADLLVRPVEGANHIAWQIGHLITVENQMGAQLPGASMPELPAGFAAQYENKPEAQKAAGGFAGKEQFLNLFNKTREATLAALAKLNDADLDKPSKGIDFIPDLGGLLNLFFYHAAMHGGQFSVVRRKLGKPVLF